MKVTTKTGFSWDIDKEKLDSWEVVEFLSDVEDNQISAYKKLFMFLLGKKGYEELKNHCRGKKNYINAKRMDAELRDMIASAKEVKN